MQNLFTWAIIGAGPAGIAAVGKLLDHGINPKEILWIDPEFKVGDFGTKWRKVSSNTKANLFTKFLNDCQSFNYNEQDFPINQINPHETCLLEYAAEPLQWVSNHLREKIHSITGVVKKLKLAQRCWHLSLNDKGFMAKNVVLAIGSEPTSLSFPEVEEIPLSTALNPELLNEMCKQDDIVGVFGSSHSAIIIIQSLLEKCNVKKILNFYLEPLRYAVYFEDAILFDNTGLKGNTAIWAREFIDGNMPAKLERHLSIENNIKEKLPLCNKAVYATGFAKRHIDVEGLHTLAYNDRSGIIAPGLFGLGIAFPEAKIDRFGIHELRVGLWKFMDYLNRVLPVWFKYGA